MNSHLSPAGRLLCEPSLSEPDYDDEPESNMKPCPDCDDPPGTGEPIELDAKRCRHCQISVIAECNCSVYYDPDVDYDLRPATQLIGVMGLQACGSAYADRADRLEMRRCPECRGWLSVYLDKSGRGLEIATVQGK